MILTINQKFQKAVQDRRSDRIEEWEEESWADTEQNLKDTLSEILGIRNVKIERAIRVGDKK